MDHSPNTGLCLSLCFSAGIEIAKANGAKYRLGPELEIRYDGEIHYFKVLVHVHRLN